MRRRGSHYSGSTGRCEACQCSVIVHGRNTETHYENRAFRQALRGHLLMECLGTEKAKQRFREMLDGYDRGGRIESRG